MPLALALALAPIAVDAVLIPDRSLTNQLPSGAIRLCTVLAGSSRVTG